ncbi:pyridoxal phosphate-dependent decarboxylase family protein [Nocardia fluminea]|uniref:Glutamate/tyrosine decarboxylase-like PLP-dependent enzyme n=1 Tax=Nocardia fluminea TaxID=134984 RepID=A0A2N3VFV8_9NOCA|nr:pyridoxal-dependent decarboxylase [Nocardia fluminea]PKV80476.1 glutamate/tyrosine decarboxylase-like PLP-dependent enzyme [Nocardia fluminea]
MTTTIPAAPSTPLPHNISSDEGQGRGEPLLDVFQHPDSADLADIHRWLGVLEHLVGPYIDPAVPRTRREDVRSFGQILEHESLPTESSSPEAVLAELAPYFQGMMRWNHPGTMINVTPPPTTPAVAAAAYASALNPNGAQDMSSGLLLGTELAVVKMLSQLAGIDVDRSGGVFTFGGKSTNMHAIKHGIQRAQPHARREGIRTPVRVVSSTQGHPCHEEACGWLGIGESSCLRVPTRPDGVMDLAALENTIRTSIGAGEQVVTIFANGGTTIQMLVDPIGDIVALRDRLVEELGLDYVPRVHVDSVVGWVWLFFRDYDFRTNPCEFPSATLSRIRTQAARIAEIYLADSFGVDFHKTGFASYVSSIYMVADRNEIYQQGGITDADHPIGGGGRKGLPHQDLQFGNHSPFQYTLELSRSMAGPLQAYVNLKMLGVAGYQRLIGGLLVSSQRFADELTAQGRFEVLSDADSHGFAVLFIAKPAVDTPSLFDRAWTRDDLESIARYNYGFYRYLFEQQELGRCPIACDYSSGYHKLVGGAKIGVHKSYPMSPFYDEDTAVAFALVFGEMLAEYDRQPADQIPAEGPHEARPLIFRPGSLT